MRCPFPSRSIPHLILLSLHLYLSTTADILCYDALHTNNPSYPRPSLADCQYLLAHIPHTPSNHEPTHPQRTLSPTYLFPITTHFHHGACRITISLFDHPILSNLLHSGIDPPLAIFFKAENPHPLTALLSESQVMRISALARDGAQRIVDKCMSGGRVGFKVGLLELPDSPNAWYLVSLGTLADETSTYEHELISMALAALRGELIPWDEDEQRPNCFDMVSYQV